MVDKLKSDQTEMVADRDKLSKMLAISREREINSQQRVTVGDDVIDAIMTYICLAMPERVRNPLQRIR